KEIAACYRGFNRLAKRSGVALVGGDTNIARSLIVSVCLFGNPPARPVRRSGARAGDDIYVTGTLGDSALGLALLRKGLPNVKSSAEAQMVARHHRPTPRLATGADLARRKLATAMIDISDGLLQDLDHICHASGVGAVIWHGRLPLSRAYRELAGQSAKTLALNGGEDYELLFCARPNRRAQIERLSAAGDIAISRIGQCLPATKGITVLDNGGKTLSISRTGHDHFKKHSPRSTESLE
ncbi:MAG: thiamine-phosphate kinase, partial [Deltaproteobacteria bacterium]|nr:thiamine-phosphate kinase [Deltaproteobacteria bacterium]